MSNTLTDLYIAGAGGLGKEVLNVLIDSNSEYRFKGFIDNVVLGEVQIGEEKYKVYSQNEDLSKLNLQNSAVFIAVGNPTVLKALHHFYKLKGVVLFPNIIHPTAYIAKSVPMGEGNFIGQNTVISIDVVIGNFNLINLSSTVGHDCIINNYNVINPGCNISGGVVIKDFNLLGTNSTIVQYVNIENNCTIAAGSMISKDAIDGSLLVGNPARIMKINK